MEKQFGLRKSFIGGQKGIRSVVIWEDEGQEILVATGGMDGSIKIWSLKTGEMKFAIDAHQGTVSCLQYKNGFLISGSFDHTLKVWKNGACVATLRSHTEEVSCFAIIKQEDNDNNSLSLVSGSWDKTLKIWRDGQLVQTLSGHEHGVMAVAILPNGDIVSGSGEGKMTLWKMPQGTATPLFGSHKMCVRCLAFGAGKLWSSANDGQVKIWSPINGGVILQETIDTKDEYMYSFGTIFPPQVKEGVILWTGGERGEAVVWASGVGNTTQLQTLPHPAALWGMASKKITKKKAGKDKEKEEEGGEEEETLMVTGCGDGVARVWSTSVFKWEVSPEEYVNAFNEAKEAEMSEAKALDNPDIPVQNLAVLSRQGKYPGETVKVDAGGGTTSLFKWNQQEMTWQEVSSMQTQAGSSNKQDVFPISTDGNNTYTLTFVHGSNPYEVAQDFITQNGLSSNFVTQIVEHIIKNTTDPAVLRNLTGDFTQARAPSQDSSPCSKKWKLFPGGIEKPMGKIEEFGGWGAGGEEQRKFRALCSTINQQGDPSKEQMDIFYQFLGWPQDKLFPVFDLVRAALLQKQFLAPLVSFSSPSGQSLIQLLVSAGTKQGGPPPAWLFSFRSLAHSLAVDATCTHPSAFEFPYAIISLLSEIGEGVKMIAKSGKASGLLRAAISAFFHNLFLFISEQGIVLMPEVSEMLCSSMQEMGECICFSGDDSSCLTLLSSLDIAQAMAEGGGMNFLENNSILSLLSTIEASVHLSVEVLQKAQELLNKQKKVN